MSYAESRSFDQTKEANNMLLPSPESKISLDLDEIIQFEEALHKLKAIADNNGLDEDAFVPHRVFINAIDCYNSKYISYILSDKVVGGTRVEEEWGEEEGGEAEIAEEEEGEEKDVGEEAEEVEDEELQVTEKEVGLSPKSKEKVKQNYEIVGTLLSSNSKTPGYIKKIISPKEGREKFMEEILKCGYIIYDITTCYPQVSEARWVIEEILHTLDDLNEADPLTFKKSKHVQYFILLSPLLTWARTRPLDPQEPDLPFNESDYRKRKPHPNYVDHCNLEKEVVQAGKKYRHVFRTIVVGTGITYGKEQCLLSFLFRRAWMNEKEMPVFKPGTNVLPLINILDLANIIYHILEKFPKKLNYLLAVEAEPPTLLQIVKSISKLMSTGKVRKIDREEAFLIPEMTQQIYDMLTMNLNMEAVYVNENMDMQWVSEKLFVENIFKIINEYKEGNRLRPVKIFIHGPPACGKSKLATRLCNYYHAHHLRIREVIDSTIEDLKAKIEEALLKREKKPMEEMQEEEKGEENAVEAEEEDSDDERENVADIENYLMNLLKDMETHNNRLDVTNLTRIFKDRLLSHPCQNQGYVLDGYPKLFYEAEALFEQEGGDLDDEAMGEEGDEEEEYMENVTYNRKLMPDYVISLEADDEFLKRRVMQLPEKDVQGTSYTEEKMIERLSRFRENNNDYPTVLDYFDEREIHPIKIDVTIDSDDLDNIFQKIVEKIGSPKPIFGDVPKEEARDGRKSALEKSRLLQRQEFERQEHEKRMKCMADWAELVNSLKQKEEEIIAIQAKPLRHYLMTYVIPTLSRGLLEVAKVRPSDPVDYLAEFLFRENPEGKMFHPEYCETSRNIVNAVNRYKEVFGEKSRHTTVSLEALEKCEMVGLSATEIFKEESCVLSI